MYTDLNIYYLNMLGITPWVIKPTEDTSSSTNLSASFCKLVLITASDLRVKEHNLLNNILFFIGLPKEQIRHLNVEQFIALSKSIKSPVILSFGAHNLLSHLERDATFIEVESLNYLLTNPAAKKALGTQLSPYLL